MDAAGIGYADSVPTRPSQEPTMSPRPTLSPDEARARIQREVALGYRIFAALRWGDLGDGHISGRDPERKDCFWLLRYGISYHVATIRDLVLVGPDGSVVEGEGAINPAAYYIHHPVLAARPDVVSAAHVHTGWGTPFAAELRPVEPITQESCIFFEDHALFDDEEVQIQDCQGGERIARAMGSNRAIILRNHGLLTVGPDVAEAVASFVLLERVAEAHMKARHAKPISTNSARYAKSDLTRPGSARRSFKSLLRRHVPDPSVID